MKTKKTQKKSLLAFREVSPQFGVLQILNVDSGKYVDTKIKIIYSDVDLNDRVQMELKKLGEEHDALVAKVDLDAIKEEAEKEAIVARESTGLSDADIDAVKSYAIASASMLTQGKLGEMAKSSFNSVFGADALESLVEGQFGICFTPDFLTTVSLMQAVTALATSLSADKIGKTYAKINSAVAKIKDRYDNV